MPTWRKILSNFHLVADGKAPLIVLDTRGGGALSASGGGGAAPPAQRAYPSVEHAFQAAKYLHGGYRDAAVAFQWGGSIKGALAAKQAGSRKGMASRGASLDVAAWGRGEADRVMTAALRSRFVADPVFRTVLAATAATGITLVHFERSPAKSYWGGAVKESEAGAPVVVGRNRLGEMMMLLRDAPPEVAIGGDDA